MSDSNLTIDDLNALPEKMRAHAAAKAVGMTSKEFLAAMAGIGVEVKSAQSAVTREVLLTWFAGRGDGGATVVEEPAAEEPVEKAPAKKAPAKKTTQKKAPAKKATAEKKAPAEKTAAEKKAPAEKTAAEKKAPARTAPARRPLPEMAIVTGEVGTVETGNSRRRSTATPSFSPLFLSPEETAARAEEDRPARTRRAATDAPRSGTQRDDRAATETTEEADPREDADTTDEQDETGDAAARRRRRGRRGRGRGRGENADEQTSGSDEDGDAAEGDGDRAASGSSDDSTRPADGSADDSDGRDDSDGQDDSDGDDSDGSEESSSGSRRRRRRRRRSGSSAADDGQSSGDDQPQPDGSDREPRRRPARGGQGADTSADEVQGITGSTRLEAKRQRRRDGRDAGRRRQPILSESEFLARRESVDRVMVVREKQRADGEGVMTQVGVLEDKVLVEHFVTTESARSMVGNVYLGRVQNVLPSMEAAFVDIGRNRNGVLYAGEVNWEAAGLGGKARRIEQALKPGDMVLVQVTKDPVGQKGARLSTQISLAGRFLVYVPDGNSTGISRKLPDTERRRLKAILKDVVPEGSGVIIRTAAEGVSEEEIGRDVERLATQWNEIAEASAKRTASGSGSPVALYEEPDLLVKVVRDLFNEDFTKLVIQGDTSWDTVHDYVSRVAPEMVERVQRYDNPDVDVFSTHRVDEQLAKALDRKVWLPSGGSLVIDRTEAMTVIDVNTGKYTGSGGNLEETVTRNNLEAAEEIVRQLRLRDVGGMVIIDFIDMVLEANRDLVLRRLTEALGRDRTRHQVSEVTSLGLVQLTRKKLGTGLVEAFSTPCEHCQGRGLIVHADPVHTESHNADEPGARRGRRRGGKGGDQGQVDGSAGGSSSSTAPKQAPRKDGPAPAAHPAALAISRQEAERAAAESEATAERAAADVAPAADPTPAGATAATDRAGDEATTPDSGVADSSAGESTRPPRRRRRSTRRPADGTPEPGTAVEDENAVEDGTGTPVVEATATATDTATDADTDAVAAGEDVRTVEPAAPADEIASSTPGTPASPPSADAGPVEESSGRRPRRRSTRREAGSAAPADADQAAAPVAVVPVAAAPLAQAPTAVVAEPRQRPARRRATRSTIAPGDADH